MELRSSTPFVIWLIAGLIIFCRGCHEFTPNKFGVSLQAKLFRSFCKKAQGQPGYSSDPLGTIQAFGDELTAHVDTFFLVDDMEAIMGDLLDVTDPSLTCDFEGMNDTALVDKLVSTWVLLEAPVAMRKAYGIDCSNRYFP